MKTIINHIVKEAFKGRTIIALLAALFLAGTARAQIPQPPAVTNVTAAQSGSVVNISYTISDPSSTNDNVWLIVSGDGGNTWTVPATSFIGTKGIGVSVTPTPTVENVNWNVTADWNGQFNSQTKVRVIADNNNMVLIPAGTYNR